MPDVPLEFQWRVEKARAEMTRAGCEVLILDSSEAMAWISGYSVSETMYRAVFLPREGSPWFVLRSLDVGPCREGGWIQDVIGYRDSEVPGDVMAAELQRRGFGMARLGVDFASVSWNPARMAALAGRLPGAAFVDLTGITDSLRWVKSDAEISFIREAASIADKTMAELARVLRAGSTTREAAAIAAGSFLRGGADTGETGPMVIGRGHHEFLHGLFRADALGAGDVLHVELIPTVSRYGARMMRPILIGPPSGKQQEIAAKLITLQDAQIAAMKPGAVAADVDAIVRAGILEGGLRDVYENVTGYTLGLYSRTPRSSDFSRALLPDQLWELEENMVFHVYTTAAGLGFSETVVVTPEGGRRLTQTPRRILVCGEEC